MVFVSSLDKQESLRVQGLPPTKPLNLVVITDGVTDDPETLIQTILNIVSRLEEGNFPLKEVGIQFIQIGCSSFVGVSCSPLSLKDHH